MGTPGAEQFASSRVPELYRPVQPTRRETQAVTADREAVREVARSLLWFGRPAAQPTQFPPRDRVVDDDAALRAADGQPAAGWVEDRVVAALQSQSHLA